MSDKSQLDLAVLLSRGPDEAPVLTPQEEYLLAIADELANDPMSRGYAGKSPDEQAELLNATWYEMVPQQMTPRIAAIISGIAFAPNAASPEDIGQAVTMQAALEARQIFARQSPVS
jgi:hypothetical protein